jgi:hypothetical protein
MRLNLEQFLAWLFFNDHAIEWAAVSAGAADFPMRKQNLDYLRRYGKRFGERMDLLAKHKTRQHDDPYQTLSHFVHGSALGALPSFIKLDSVVHAAADAENCVNLQRSTSEYLSDIATCWLILNWHDFPRS